MDKQYIYLFVREDLSKPQQIVQVAHAVDEMKNIIGKTNKTSYMVLFGAKDEFNLSVISEYLSTKGIEHEMFYEPDIVSHTAIATRPLLYTEREAMKRFKLLK